MGKLIVVLGNSGSGKTTLTKLLCQKEGYQGWFEQHGERPFQRLFQEDLQRYAFANQMDYLLYRCEQEIRIREQEGIGVQDGGLDLDYYVFTHLFHQNGYLNAAEFELCQRFYLSQRQLLKAPDLILYLNAPLETLARRKAKRERELDVSTIQDLKTMQVHLDKLLSSTSAPVMQIDTSDNDPAFSRHLKPIQQRIETL